MKLFRITLFAIAFLLLIAAKMLGIAFFPIGALVVFPLIYQRWFTTLLFALMVGLLWESSTPLPFGSVALPLAAGCVLLQLVARHQFRSNLATKILGALLLQSVVVVCVGLKFPPQTIASAGTQLWETLGQLWTAAFVCPLWLWGLEKLAQARFGIDIKGSLKDL